MAAPFHWNGRNDIPSLFKKKPLPPTPENHHFVSYATRIAHLLSKRYGVFPAKRQFQAHVYDGEAAEIERAMLLLRWATELSLSLSHSLLLSLSLSLLLSLSPPHVAESTVLCSKRRTERGTAGNNRTVRLAHRWTMLLITKVFLHWRTGSSAL